MHQIFVSEVMYMKFCLQPCLPKPVKISGCFKPNLPNTRYIIPCLTFSNVLPLYVTAETGSVECSGFAALTTLFSYSYSVNYLKSQQSAWTLLHLAAVNGHLEACKLHILNIKAVMFISVGKNLILAHESDKSPQNSSSVTPLHLAAKSGPLFILIETKLFCF